MENKIRVGITHGDINGISYEIIIKTFLDSRMLDFCTPIVYGSPKVGAYHRKTLNINNFNFNHIKDATEADVKRVNIIHCVDDNIRVELGKPSEEAGLGSFQALEKAVADMHSGLIDVIVTAPIQKHNIQSDKFNFPGHTEYLADRFKTKNVLMLMLSEQIKIGVLTGHVPLSEVSKYVTVENIIVKLKIIEESLRIDFGVRKPRIAVFGLNPHAGDNGVIGMEEKNIIIPALEEANKMGIIALGPYPADGFFGSASFRNFDAVLAMYHDQGLAPFKAQTFDTGVNYTAGLPIVRTSPAHGTAYKIAGKNEASADSFRQALYTACDVFENRKMYKKITENPLVNPKAPVHSSYSRH